MNNEQNQNNQNVDVLNTPPVVGPDNITPGVSNVGSVTPIPPVENINLQPEGVVPPAPVNDPNNAGVVEPLMSTPLTPNMNFNNSVGMDPQPMAMNQNMMPNQPMDFMGVPTPPPLPPEQNGKKEKKKGMNKVLLILLIVVLIGGVGYAIYYFLVASKAKTNVIITPKLVEVELGTTIEKKASNFVTVSGYDVNSCTVETNLDSMKYGTYQYTVTCGKKTSDSQSVSVKDTLPPVIVLNEVIVLPNTEVTPDDFFESIEDASEYTVEFDEEIDTSLAGTFQVSITVSDDYENKTSVVGSLIVDENAPATNLTCEKEGEGTDPTITNIYRFGISTNGNRYNTYKTVEFVYENEETYLAAVTEYEENNSLNEIEGSATYDEENYTIFIKVALTEDDLTKEFETIPTTEDDIQTIFENKCELSLN